MKHEDKQFDDFLRSRHEQRKFEMKDQYWTNAQELINAHRKSNSRGILTFTFSAIVLVSLSAALFWKNTNNPVVQSSGQEQQLYTAQVNPSNDIDAAVTATNQDHNGTEAESRNSDNTVANAHDMAAPANANTNNGNNSNNNRNEADAVAVLASYASTEAGNSSSDITNVAEHTRSTADNKATTRTSKAKRATQNGSLNAADITNEMASGEAKRYDALTASIIGGRFYQPGPTTIELDSFNKKEAFLAYSIREQKNFLTVEGGINSYNMGSDVLKSLDLHGGLRYYYFVAPRIGLSSGLSYSRIHQNLGTRTFRNIDYSFGRQTSETKITTVRLDYIELPLDIHYRVTGNHFATAGALLGYAIQSGEYVEGDNNDTRTNGHMNAINRFDMQLHLGYNYFLNNRYTFSAGYYFGLMDISNNTAYKSNQFDRNAGLRITLGYKIF